MTTEMPTETATRPCDFQRMGLADTLLHTVRSKGYHTATPIQSQAIPSVMLGGDLMGCAQTGTGKTAAFALPTLHRLMATRPAHAKRPQQQPQRPVNQNRRRKPQRLPAGPVQPIRCLVLAPTRELAAQIQQSFSLYGQKTGLRNAVIFGGVGQNPQVKALRAGVDILVATPGRLLDLRNQGHVDLSKVEVLILDEADQMLDMGFLPDLKRIVAAVPRERQTLMFSATMPNEIRRLADQWLSEPTNIEVARVSSPTKQVNQSIYFVEQKLKSRLLVHYLQSSATGRTLVFARTKHGADKIVKQLDRAGIRAAAIHGNKSQNARTRALEQFKSKHPPVLVATDIAARGLDVSGVSHVINYELPEVPETYVHRIGRTGRAGATGVAVSFCGGQERSRLFQIEKLTRRRIPVVETPKPFRGAAAPAPSSGATSGRSGQSKRHAGRGPQSAGKQDGKAAGSGAAAAKRRRRKPRPAQAAEGSHPVSNAKPAGKKRRPGRRERAASKNASNR